MTKDTWQVTCDTWHVTPDRWHLTHYGKHYVKISGPQLTSRTPESVFLKLRQIGCKRRFMGLKEFRGTEVIQFVNHMILLLMWNYWHWFLSTYTFKDGRFLFKKDFRQKFGTSPVGMSWDGKHMIPTQSQRFAILSPDQPPLLF